MQSTSSTSGSFGLVCSREGAFACVLFLALVVAVLAVAPLIEALVRKHDAHYRRVVRRVLLVAALAAAATAICLSVVWLVSGDESWRALSWIAIAAVLFCIKVMPDSPRDKSEHAPR